MVKVKSLDEFVKKIPSKENLELDGRVYSTSHFVRSHGKNDPLTGMFSGEKEYHRIDYTPVGNDRVVTYGIGNKEDQKIFKAEVIVDDKVIDKKVFDNNVDLEVKLGVPNISKEAILKAYLIAYKKFNSNKNALKMILDRIAIARESGLNYPEFDALEKSIKSVL